MAVAELQLQPECWRARLVQGTWQRRQLSPEGMQAIIRDGVGTATASLALDSLPWGSTYTPLHTHARTHTHKHIHPLLKGHEVVASEVLASALPRVCQRCVSFSYMVNAGGFLVPLVRCGTVCATFQGRWVLTGDSKREG